MAEIMALLCDEIESGNEPTLHLSGQCSTTACGHVDIMENTYENVFIKPSELTCYECKMILKDIVDNFKTIANMRKAIK